MEVQVMERYLELNLMLNGKIVLTKREDIGMHGAVVEDDGMVIPSQLNDFGQPHLSHNELSLATDMIKEYKYATLEYYEKTFPDDAKNKAYVAVDVFVSLYVCDGDHEKSHTVVTSLPQRIWTRCQKLLNETTDGYVHTIPVTETPIMIQFESFPDFFVPVGDDPIRLWLFTDINHMTNTQIDYCAEIKIKESINWGFNGINAVLLFRQQCEKYTQVMMNPDGTPAGEFIQINYHPHIGYWFGTLLLETVQKYFKIEDPNNGI